MKNANTRQPLIMIALLSALIVQTPALAITTGQTDSQSGYIARDEGINGVFEAIASRLGKPVILSKNARNRKISGNFDLKNPQLMLDTLSEQLGLIWYQDGQSVYVYDAGEMRSVVLTLRNIRLKVLTDYLRQARLYDARYAPRSDDVSSTIYVSGPPVYIDMVTSIARFLDERQTIVSDNGSKIDIIQLNNTFVGDRKFRYRDEDMVIPGMATVLQNLLSSSDASVEIVHNDSSDTAIGQTPPVMPDFNATKNITPRLAPPVSLTKALASRPGTSALKIIANPGNNSLLIKGSASQVDYIHSLVQNLDVQKRHIELSVWIVDLQKEALDQLGVQWNGSVNMGGTFDVSLNGGASSTVDGARFMASVMALRQNDRANIVARPMILTQENIPAIFDNSRTFYTQLIGERAVDLQHVTYGTSVSVLPRFNARDEIEMMLNVEDGNAVPDNQQVKGQLPDVGRTNISTVARVPRGKSLLIGGYTRNESSGSKVKIPLLGDIPWIGGLFRYHKNHDSNMVRVFLIQPREITEPMKPDANELIQTLKTLPGQDSLQDWMQNYLESQPWK